MKVSDCLIRSLFTEEEDVPIFEAFRRKEALTIELTRLLKKSASNRELPTLPSFYILNINNQLILQ